MNIIVGIDLSLTATGVAVIATGGEGSPIQGQYVVSTVKSKPSDSPSVLTRLARMQRITKSVVDHCLHADLVVVEGPSFASRNGQAHDRAGLWWMVTDAIVEEGIDLAVCPPSSRMKYATGKGNASKDAVLAAAIRRYPDAEISNNNEADAFVLAAMGARWLGAQIEPTLPMTHLTAMGGVAWPRT